MSSSSPEGRQRKRIRRKKNIKVDQDDGAASIAALKKQLEEANAKAKAEKDRRKQVKRQLQEANAKAEEANAKAEEEKKRRREANSRAEEAEAQLRAQDELARQQEELAELLRVQCAATAKSKSNPPAVKFYGALQPHFNPAGWHLLHCLHCCTEINQSEPESIPQYLLEVSRLLLRRQGEQHSDLSAVCGLVLGQEKTANSLFMHTFQRVIDFVLQDQTGACRLPPLRSSRSSSSTSSSSSSSSSLSPSSSSSTSSSTSTSTSTSSGRVSPERTTESGNTTGCAAADRAAAAPVVLTEAAFFGAKRASAQSESADPELTSLYVDGLVLDSGGPLLVVEYKSDTTSSEKFRRELATYLNNLFAAERKRVEAAAEQKRVEAAAEWNNMRIEQKGYAQGPRCLGVMISSKLGEGQFDMDVVVPSLEACAEQSREQPMGLSMLASFKWNSADVTVEEHEAKVRELTSLLWAMAYHCVAFGEYELAEWAGWRLTNPRAPHTGTLAIHRLVKDASENEQKDEEMGEMGKVEKQQQQQEEAEQQQQEEAEQQQQEETERQQQQLEWETNNNKKTNKKTNKKNKRSRNREKKDKGKEEDESGHSMRPAPATYGDASASRGSASSSRGSASSSERSRRPTAPSFASGPLSLSASSPVRASSARPGRQPRVQLLVVKVYDYRGRSHRMRETHRSPEFYLGRVVGAKLVLDTPLLKVLTYPLVSGEPWPTSVPGQWFTCVAEQLEKLHEEGLVHGDVRGANMLYLSDPNSRQISAQLLDFDYTFKYTENQQRLYPPTWTLDLPDTERHPAITEQSLEHRSCAMCAEHDRYSFGGVLYKYQPKRLSERTKWEELRLKVMVDRPPLWPEIIELLEEWRTEEFEHKQPSDHARLPGVGTPPRTHVRLGLATGPSPQYQVSI